MSLRLAVLKSSENKLTQDTERWKRDMARKAEEDRSAIAQTEAEILRYVLPDHILFTQFETTFCDVCEIASQCKLHTRCLRHWNAHE